MGGFFATNIGSTMPFGMDGWRFAFHLMAAVSLVTSALVFYVATDPRPTAKVHVPFAQCLPVSVSPIQFSCVYLSTNQLGVDHC